MLSVPAAEESRPVQHESMQPVLEEGPAGEPECRAHNDLNQLRVRAHEHQKRCKADRRAAADSKIDRYATLLCSK